MPFWTVEDAGPYKKIKLPYENQPFDRLVFYVKIMTNATKTPTATANEVSLE